MQCFCTLKTGEERYSRWAQMWMSQYYNHSPQTTPSMSFLFDGMVGGGAYERWSVSETNQRARIQSQYGILRD